MKPKLYHKVLANGVRHLSNTDQQPTPDDEVDRVTARVLWSYLMESATSRAEVPHRPITTAPLPRMTAAEHNAYPDGRWTKTQN